MYTVFISAGNIYILFYSKYAVYCKYPPVRNQYRGSYKSPLFTFALAFWLVYEYKQQQILTKKGPYNLVRLSH